MGKGAAGKTGRKERIKESRAALVGLEVKSIERAVDCCVVHLDTAC